MLFHSQEEKSVAGVVEALKRKVTKGSFDTIILLLNALKMSVEEVAQLYSEEKNDTGKSRAYLFSCN